MLGRRKDRTLRHGATAQDSDEIVGTRTCPNFPGTAQPSQAALSAHVGSIPAPQETHDGVSMSSRETAVRIALA